MNSQIAFFLLAFCASARSAQIPDYIKPCDIGSTFDKCAVDHANQAISVIVNGDRKVGIPSLKPLKLSELKIERDNFKFVLKDVVVHGIENAKATRIDLNTKQFDGDFYIDSLSVLGQYEISGKITLVNLEGQGAANITAVGGNYHVKAPLKTFHKNNERYLKLSNPEVDFELEKLNIDLQNLFNGDHILGPQVNEFLNENWKDVISDLGAPIKETVGAIIETIATKILARIPISKGLIPE